MRILAKALEMGLHICCILHEEALLDIHRGISIKIHSFCFVGQACSIDPDVYDGGWFLVPALEEDLVEDDEDLADRTEHSHYVLAISGLVRCLGQQLLGQWKVHLWVFLHFYQQFPVVVLVGDGLSGYSLTKIEKSCM